MNLYFFLELLAHVQLLLTSAGLTDSAKLLGEEIEKKGFVPKRFNFLGEPCSQSFDEYVLFIILCYNVLSHIFLVLTFDNNL